MIDYTITSDTDTRDHGRRNSRPMPRHRRERLENIATVLDDRFRIPGTNMRFGLDGLIGLIPGIGDTVTTAIGSYIISEAWRAGIPKRKLVKMGGNLTLDWFLGLVPFAGDLLDFGFKSHRRNLRILLDETHPVD